MNRFLKNYGATLALLAGILLGALCGILWPDAARAVGPVGELFLNLIFVMIVPLVFFSIAGATCGLRRGGILGKVLLSVLAVFAGMSLVAALTGWLGTCVYSPFDAADRQRILGAIAPDLGSTGERLSPLKALVGALTVSDFGLLLSKEHLLALIVFAALFGYAVCLAGPKGRPMETFIQSGSEVMVRMMKIVMVAAPVGLGCYFADTVARVGSQLLGGYLRVLVLYLALTLLFFFGINSLYVLTARGKEGLKNYWKHIWDPVATAVATSSSAATMPVAIEAAKRMGVRTPVAEAVIPLGTHIHKDGSVMGAVFKIVFLMLLTGRPMSGWGVLLTIVGVALMEAVVLGAVPGGGLAGEVFICSVLGFSPDMVGVIVVIGTIIDIPATLLNVNANVVAALLVDRMSPPAAEEA
ncbi:MAG: dicarboxylate/amino acid:cation symporter [Bacteroidales bacterium]|nr:dicarboxylate/amino acid:cation symporter [Bacteroidales bacterium]